MTTPLGKVLKLHRRKRNLFLKDMAMAINVSPSYLSSVETGKKPLSTKIQNEIVKFFKLTGPEKEELIQKAEQSSFRLDIYKCNLDWEQRKLVNAFARKLESGALALEEGEEWLEKIQD